MKRLWVECKQMRLDKCQLLLQAIVKEEQTQFTTAEIQTFKKV